MRRKLSRRRFITLAATTAAAGPFFVFPNRTFASQRKLRIAHWPHFVPEYDRWFDGEYVKEWGKKHDTEVVVTRIPIDQINARAASEVAARKGHDLFLFPAPPAIFHRHVIDHAEVYDTAARRHGNISPFAHKSTYDPRTKRYFAFTDSWIPAPLLFFQNCWSEINMPLGPPSFDSLRSGVRRIHAQSGIPCGLSFAPRLDGNITLQAVLWGFRAFVQDPGGRFKFNQNLSTQAFKYAKALYDDAGTPEQLTWGPSGNAQAMLTRKTSCTINAISLLRDAEQEFPDVARNILIKPPMLGMDGVMGPPHVTNCWAIWSFAENKTGAVQFLADLADNSRTVYEKSKSCNFPMYQNTVPNLIVKLSKDPKADPAWKYESLKDALHWTRNLGYPGYATPAAMEVFNTSVFPSIVASVVKGEVSPEDGAREAEKRVRVIFEKWKQI